MRNKWDVRQREKERSQSILGTRLVNGNSANKDHVELSISPPARISTPLPILIRTDAPTFDRKLGLHTIIVTNFRDH